MCLFRLLCYSPNETHLKSKFSHAIYFTLISSSRDTWISFFLRTKLFDHYESNSVSSSLYFMKLRFISIIYHYYNFLARINFSGIFCWIFPFFSFKIPINSTVISTDNSDLNSNDDDGEVISYANSLLGIYNTWKNIDSTFYSVFWLMWLKESGEIDRAFEMFLSNFTAVKFPYSLNRNADILTIVISSHIQSFFID